MNLLMTGMVGTTMILKSQLGQGLDPTQAAFWFVMSMALLVGAILAYPINWWLVRYHLKHGMTTIRPAIETTCCRIKQARDGRVANAGMARLLQGSKPWR